MPLGIVFLLSGAITWILYKLFFLFSPWFWTLYTKLPPETFTIWARENIGGGNSDGIETYVLYVLAFLAIALSFLANYFLSKKNDHRLNRIVLICTLALSLAFVVDVGLNPPMADVAQGGAWFVVLSFAALLGAFSLLSKKPYLLTATIIPIVFLLCFIPAKLAPSLPDENFIIAPAIRFLSGLALNASYSQYDYLLPLLVSLWVKCHQSLYTFHIVEISSYFLMLLGLYFFAQKYFLKKTFALHMIVMLIIVKIFATMGDIALCCQFSPLRLDWWIPLLVLVYWRGASHWAVAVLLATLILFHHAFGVIYALSYLILTFVLAGSARDYLRLYLRNIVILILAFLIYQIFLLPQTHNAAAVSYQQYGIGFMQISQQSFYWYFFPILSIITLLLWRNRGALSTKYFQAGLFIVLLAIGNSVYFFGRSHENNIINVGVVLILTVFLLFDLLYLELSKHQSSILNGRVVLVCSVALILAASYIYSAKIIDRSQRQYSYLMAHHSFSQFQQSGGGLEYDVRAYPFLCEVAPRLHLQEVKDFVGSSRDIVFLTLIDGYYYFEGGYVPKDFNCLTKSWFIKNDLLSFLTNHLTAGGYVVIPTNEAWKFMDYINSLHHDRNLLIRSPHFYFLYNPDLILNQKRI